MQLDLSSTDYWAEIFTTKNYLGEKSIQVVKEEKKGPDEKGGPPGKMGSRAACNVGSSGHV